jgi:hypothetical protein
MHIFTKMIQLWTENNKLYTYRPNLKNWEFNAKLLSSDKFNALKKDRTELLDIGTLLVMPEEDYLLVLGGNQRNTVDEELGRDKEPIELIGFKQMEDGRWYVISDLIQKDDGSWDGQIRTDLKSFSTKLAAMKTYSYKHNSQYAAYTEQTVREDINNPELGDIDFTTIFTNIGEPKSLLEGLEEAAQEAQGSLEQLSQEIMKEGMEEPVPPVVESATLEAEKTDAFKREEPQEVDFTRNLVECPSCSEQFDFRKHKVAPESPSSFLPQTDEDPNNLS